MIHSSPKHHARLRNDVRVHARRIHKSNDLFDHCLLHHPISGKTFRVDFESYKRLRSGAFEDNEHLAVEAASHGLLTHTQSLRSSENRRDTWWRNPLYIRFAGFPADRIAKQLAHLLGWLFSVPMMLFSLVTFMCTATILFSKASIIWDSLPALARFQAEHWMLALFVLGSTKVLHELAHATACRCMGAACREIGVLLLCGTPCLYCDVSESWRIISRRRRAVVMLAGIYVEAIVASIAAWVWITADPSFAKILALHVVMVCGISTIAFNINPLMRYDGYFVLSDLLNVTNLRSKAAEAWQQTIIRPLTGQRTPWSLETPLSSPRLHRFFLIFYHASASVYRYVIVVGLTSWFYYLLSLGGLEPIGRGAAVFVVIVIVWGQLKRFCRMLLGFGMWKQVTVLRRIVLSALSLAVVGMILFIPWNRRITTYGYLDYADVSHVYIPEEGIVTGVFVEIGEGVVANQPVLKLESPQLQIEEAEAISRVNKILLTLESLRMRAAFEPELLTQIRTTEVALVGAQKRLDGIHNSISNLTIVAPKTGVLLRNLPQETDKPLLERLSSFHGSIQAVGTQWCRVGDGSRKEVILSVDAKQRAAIDLNKSVRLRIAGVQSGFSEGVIDCKVSEISEIRLDQTVDPMVSAQERFEIRCSLPSDYAADIPIGASVTGVFQGESLTVAEIISDKFADVIR